MAKQEIFRPQSELQTSFESNPVTASHSYLPYLIFLSKPLSEPAIICPCKKLRQ